MDKSLKLLLLFFNSLLLVLSLILISISFIYKFFSVKAYSLMIFIIISGLAAIITAVVLAQILIVNLYKGIRIPGWFLRFILLFMKAAIPVFIQLSRILRYDKNAIRKLFVDVNNQVVEAEGIKYGSEDVIILVPHCLQYSECDIKLTSRSENCKRCGRCCIGEILDKADRYGVQVFVMSGGTAARNTVSQRNPKLIISVACERDLTTGILDVGNISVIGIENERPNGPCFNTKVSVEEINKTLEKVILYKNLHKESGGYHIK